MLKRDFIVGLVDLSPFFFRSAVTLGHTPGRRDLAVVLGSLLDALCESYAIGIPTPPPPLWGRSEKPDGADGTASMQTLEQLWIRRGT